VNIPGLVLIAIAALVLTAVYAEVERRWEIRRKR